MTQQLLSCKKHLYIGKYMKFFDLFKKKKKIQKNKVKNKSKAGLFAENIIPFNNTKTNQERLDALRADKEKDRVYQICNELVESYIKTTNRSFLDKQTIWWLFLYKTLHLMSFELCLPDFLNHIKHAKKSVLKNQNKVLDKYFPGWNDLSNNNLQEEKKEEEKTLH